MLNNIGASDNLGSLPYLRELGREKAVGAERLKPLCGLTTLVQNELRVDVINPGCFVWLQVFDRQFHLVLGELSREVGINAVRHA